MKHRLLDRLRESPHWPDERILAAIILVDGLWKLDQVLLNQSDADLERFVDRLLDVYTREGDVDDE